jgi:hypothetical protein
MVIVGNGMWNEIFAANWIWDSKSVPMMHLFALVQRQDRLVGLKRCCDGLPYTNDCQGSRQRV